MFFTLVAASLLMGCSQKTPPPTIKSVEFISTPVEQPQPSIAGRYKALYEGEPFLTLELLVDGRYVMWDCELRKIGTGPWARYGSVVICDEVNGLGETLKVKYNVSDDETMLTDNKTGLKFKQTTSFVHGKSIPRNS